jgi:hypothetical protein
MTWCIFWTVEAVTIKALEVESVQVLELEPPESGLDVVDDEVFIPRLGFLGSSTSAF